MPIVLASATLISTGLGGMAALRFRDRLHLLLGFSAGAVMAVALFDILPEVFALDGGSSYMPFAAAGFLAFFGLERYTALHRSREHVHTATAHEQELGTLSAAGLTFHSFLDGVWLAADMIAPVLGAATALVINLDGLLPWLLAFFAGSFLYIGASDLLPEAREHDSPWVGVATAMGMSAIYLATEVLRRF